MKKFYNLGAGDFTYCIQGCKKTMPILLNHIFMEIDHEIISTVILFLPLIQEGLLSVTIEFTCTKYWLTA